MPSTGVDEGLQQPCHKQIGLPDHKAAGCSSGLQGQHATIIDHCAQLLCGQQAAQAASEAEHKRKAVAVEVWYSRACFVVTTLIIAMYSNWRIWWQLLRMPKSYGTCNARCGMTWRSNCSSDDTSSSWPGYAHWFLRFSACP